MKTNPATQSLRLLPKHNVSLRAKMRRDGHVTYEAFSVLSGRVLGRSRNFARVVAHARRQAEILTATRR